MDDIYIGKTKEEIIELVYCLTKQNLSGRETFSEVFMKGIEFCYKELCDGKETTDENSNCIKPPVSNSFCECKNLNYGYTIPVCYNCRKVVDILAK